MQPDSGGGMRRCIGADRQTMTKEFDLLWDWRLWERKPMSARLRAGQRKKEDIVEEMWNQERVWKWWW
jgi:hypothetical protein